MRAILTVSAVLVAGLVGLELYRSRQAAALDYEPNTDAADWMPDVGELFPAWPAEEDQTTSLLEDVFVNLNPSTYTPANVSEEQAAQNVRAFLDMIAYAEGTANPNGYRMLFGGRLFDSYADHPRIYIPFRNTTTSAAGRYQILARTWDTLKARLGLRDFSPASQDAAAVELIRERGALNDVRAGRVAVAVSKVARIWASLPGAGYDQPERKLSALVSAYADAGGTLEQTA